MPITNQSILETMNSQLNEALDNPPLSPFDSVFCACGCGEAFIPTRSNKQYLNKVHADRYYSLVQRIKPSEEKKKIAGQLKLNQKVLLAGLEGLDLEPLGNRQNFQAGKSSDSHVLELLVLTNTIGSGDRSCGQFQLE